MRYLWLAWMMLLIPLMGWSQPAEKAVFSAPGGFYEQSFSLEIFPFYANHHIRYTTNGNQPTAQSTLYSGPLWLDERLYSASDIYTIQVAPEEQMYYPDSVNHCIVIRAAVFDENENRISEVSTNSYFIHSLGCDTHGLPVLSLCSDSLGLFDYHQGIMVPGAYQSQNMPDWTGNYFCKGREWERLCNVEFYELDNEGINQQAGLRTHGGASRRYQQKGLKIMAREEYGEKRFEHRFFEEIPIESFKHLTLKPFRGSNWKTTGYQDLAAHRVARSLGLECLATRPMVLFLNGEYWGIYALEEVPDERYLEDHFDVDPDQVNIISYWGTLDHGDVTHWYYLYQWVEQTDLSSPENYALMESKIDIDNFIDYEIFEIYSGNVDWPANNTRCWQVNNSLWRWIFYDGDGCFFRDWDVFANATDTGQAVNPTNAHSTLIFRKLIDNPSFLERFESRFRQLMEGPLSYAAIGPVFNELAETIEAEVPNQCHRFHFPPSIAKWEEDRTAVDAWLRVLNERMSQRLTWFLQHYQTNELTPEVTCYPNPFHDKVYFAVDALEAKHTELCISNLLGQVVFRERVSLKKGINIIPVNATLTSGWYFLTINNQTVKLMRQ